MSDSILTQLGTKIGSEFKAHRLRIEALEGLENVTLGLVGNVLTLTNQEGTATNIDLSLYLDDTNLSRLVSGTYDADSQSLIFTRDDDSTFSVDASMFFDDSNLVTSVAGKTGAVTLETSDITGLQTALDGKLGSTATAAAATKLATARTIALAGDVTGSVSFDGSANATITAVVVDDSHNHVISNVDGLQTALDGKLSTTGKAADSDKLDGLDSSAFARAYRFGVGSGSGLRYVRLFTIGNFDSLVVGTLTNTGDFGDPTRSIYQVVIGTRTSIDITVFQTIKGATSDEYAFYYKPVTNAYEIWVRMADYNLGNVFTELNAQGGVSYQFDSVTTTAPSGLVLVPTTKMWHSDNDGAGSGLDADLLDGLHASSFAATNATATVSGGIKARLDGTSLYLTNNGNNA